MMELPALLLITVLVLRSPVVASPQAWLPLFFWVAHYSYRSFIFPALMRPSDHSFPVVLVLFAVAFNSLNGWNNAQALIVNGTHNAPLLSMHFILGTVVFCGGFVMHIQADSIIRNLRRPGETGYGVPQGGLFRWVSNPHYLGEIVQWLGWALMTWSLAGVAFALFTFCNLAPRAISNHRWYLKHFTEYPIERKILIPGLY